MAQIFRIEISLQEVATVAALAKEMCFNGKSNVFADSEERKKMLILNQFTGQLGELALAKTVYGKHGFDVWRETRIEKNKNLFKGDDGRDLSGYRIDIKTTYWKNPKKDPYSYHLWVRPKEYHANWTYILALAKRDTPETYGVHMLGWATSNILSDDSEGRYSIKACDLNDMNTIQFVKEGDNQ